MDVSDLLEEAKLKMGESCDYMEQQLKSIQAGKITRESMDQVKVSAYDVMTPITQLARINIVDSQTISVEPYEKGMVTAIEGAISKQKKDHFVRQNKNGAIFVTLPTLTEERRKKLVKEVQGYVEQGKIQIRNHRTDVKKALKSLEKEGFSEDEIKKGEEDLQKITDEHIKNIEEVSSKKEKSLMTI